MTTLVTSPHLQYNLSHVTIFGDVMDTNYEVMAFILKHLYSTVTYIIKIVTMFIKTQTKLKELEITY